MRRRTTRRSRNKRMPLLAILSRPALSSPNVAAEMDQAAALRARGKSSRADPCGSMKSGSTATASPPGSYQGRPSSFSLVPDSTGPPSIPGPPPRSRRLRSNPPISTARFSCGVSPRRRDLLRAHAASPPDRGGAGRPRLFLGFDLLRASTAKEHSSPCRSSTARHALAGVLEKPPDGIAFSARETCDGEAFRRVACRQRAFRRRRLPARRRRHLPDDRSAWIKSKCLNLRRIRHQVLGYVGPGRVVALPGLLAARLSRRRRPAALRRPRRNRHVAEDARPPPPPPRATRRPAIRN